MGISPYTIGSTFECKVSGRIIKIVDIDPQKFVIHFVYINQPGINDADYPVSKNVRRIRIYFKDFANQFTKLSGKPVETDPSGKSANEPGAKLDADKPRFGLVLGGFASALEQVGKVGTAGAAKYSPNGWKEVDNGIERYTDAMQRHWIAEAKGEKFDPDLTNLSGENIYHAACVAWNALARLDLMIKGDENA